jgi:hypothetical protein
MSKKELKSLSECDLGHLEPKLIDPVALYNTIRRGVKNSLEPWKFSQENPNISKFPLQEAYDKEIDSRVDKIMTTVLNEFYIY